ncbi:twin-arginine translocation signal domain-containing protein [Bradyrhizobium sp. 137]|uniref:twin-arginine translocation signal domain-containing protein n=1 Tax=Bradyrhizobium sp. 137 TaxID=2782614 RepID=UPI001FF703E9|nr:twin-arginine translocation signal domain-containing protein [Bradyrhizobium sp. 137]MCK1753824.1 twin-arginine translocation signal domain-containing protein [Bradyrhizobium sp. 137]
MTEADRVLSTPPLSSSSNKLARTTTIDPVETSRRQFLAQAAAATAGGAVLGAALPGSARGADLATDPMFAAIEAHKAARAMWLSWVDRCCELEILLPQEKRLSSICAGEETIVATDDPRWIEAEREIDLTGDAELDAAYALLEVIPTTREGLLALLKYAVEIEADRHVWPDYWHIDLLANLSEVLPQLWQEGRG